MIISSPSDGRDLSDDELEVLTSTLTHHQAEAVIRRVDTLSTTMRKKKGAGKMHVKDIFPTPDNSSPVCISLQVLSLFFLCLAVLSVSVWLRTWPIYIIIIVTLHHDMSRSVPDGHFHVFYIF